MLWRYDGDCLWLMIQSGKVTTNWCNEMRRSQGFCVRKLGMSRGFPSNQSSEMRSVYLFSFWDWPWPKKEVCGASNFFWWAATWWGATQDAGSVASWQIHQQESCLGKPHGHSLILITTAQPHITPMMLANRPRLESAFDTKRSKTMLNWVDYILKQAPYCQLNQVHFANPLLVGLL